MAFEVLHQGSRPYEFRDRVHWTIAFEMSLNLRTYDREVYHALDWLGDMGGLYDGIRGIFALIVAFFTYKKYDTWMVA